MDGEGQSVIFNFNRFHRAAGAALAAVGLAASLSGCSSVRESLSTTPNLGPCPVAASLFEASRIVEIHGEELYDNVGFTGEIYNVASHCRYIKDDPITMTIDLDFALGRGPAAQGDRKTYEYFVAVTRRNTVVIEKKYFTLDVDFKPGQDRVHVRDRIDKLVIPRATETLSGANFEVLVGFKLTEEQLDFNMQGKRFRIDAGQD